MNQGGVHVSPRTKKTECLPDHCRATAAGRPGQQGPGQMGRVLEPLTLASRSQSTFSSDSNSVLARDRDLSAWLALGWLTSSRVT